MARAVFTKNINHYNPDKENKMLIIFDNNINCF